VYFEKSEGNSQKPDGKENLFKNFRRE